MKQQPPIVGANGRPVITQEAAAALQAQQMFFGVFFSLVPVVAADELRRAWGAGENWKIGDRDGEPDIDVARINRIAKHIAVATMKTIGVEIT